ncbi:MAG: hypothetical protein JXB35_03360 [Anaerolineae bacterium]|nr:hypothetical protein [Anaerolineae bacterium]
MNTKQPKRRATILILTLVGLLLALSNFPAGAQTGGAFTLPWFNIGAGSISSGGDYTLAGATGQADAGNLSGGDFTLGGGYWNGGGAEEPGPKTIFLPLLIRQ